MTYSSAKLLSSVSVFSIKTNGIKSILIDEKGNELKVIYNDLFFIPSGVYTLQDVYY
jgi:hypothetical protein